MKIASSREASQEPQRRNRGTRISTPANVSSTASASVAGKLTWYGTRSCSTMRDQPKGSVIFQTPAEIKSTATINAARWLTTFFQGGIALEALKASPRRPAVLLASMLDILAEWGRVPAGGAPFVGVFEKTASDAAAIGDQLHSRLADQNSVVKLMAPTDGSDVAA